MSRKKTELWAEAAKHKQPLKYAEFKCPACGGIATIATFQNLTVVECHACGAKIRKEANRWL